MGQLRASVMYRIHLERFAKFCGNKKTEQVKIGDIARFLEFLRERYSEKTIAYCIAILKNFLGYLRRTGIDCVDPYLLKIPRSVSRSYNALSAEDFKKMDELISTDNFSDLTKKVILRMLWDTGMRLSEIALLDISQVDSRRNWAVIQTKKNKKPRTVMWSEKTHRYLLEYLGIRICVNQQPALFITIGKGSRRQRISHRTIERWIKDLSLEAGVKDRISPHSLRHGWAHFRRDKGAPLPFIQEGLGHSSIESTIIYQQYSNREFRKTASKMFSK